MITITLFKSSNSRDGFKTNIGCMKSFDTFFFWDFKAFSLYPCIIGHPLDIIQTKVWTTLFLGNALKFTNLGKHPVGWIHHKKHFIYLLLLLLLLLLLSLTNRRLRLGDLTTNKSLFPKAEFCKGNLHGIPDRSINHIFWRVWNDVFVLRGWKIAVKTCG